MVISVRLISSENTAVAMLCLMAAARAMSIPRVELWVGIMARLARYSCSSLSTSTQRTGTESIALMSWTYRTSCSTFDEARGQPCAGS